MAPSHSELPTGVGMDLGVTLNGVWKDASPIRERFESGSQAACDVCGRVVTIIIIIIIIVIICILLLSS